MTGTYTQSWDILGKWVNKKLKTYQIIFNLHS